MIYLRSHFCVFFLTKLSSCWSFSPPSSSLLTIGRCSNNLRRLYIDDETGRPSSSIPSAKRTAGAYVRWVTDSNATALETAITTFVNPTTGVTVELHSMVHMGDASYYNYWNDQLPKSSIVLYELLIDEALLLSNGQYDRQIRPGVSIQAPPQEQDRASKLGWSCQADCIDYGRKRPNWYHADLTTQELRAVNSGAQPNTNKNFVTEAWTAFTWGPPQLQGNGRRRVFTNLWLDGDSWAKLVRTPLWLAVPTPEVFQLVFDTAVQWSNVPKSSSLNLGSNNRNGLMRSRNFPPLHAIRQWLWGQVLVTGHQVATTNDVQLQRRNARAMEVMDHWAGRDAVMLYGCHHCPDLEQRLFERGFNFVKQEYRTVWSLPPASEASPPFPIVTVLSVYAAVSALDWVALWDTIDSAEFVVLYLVRHTALYLGLSQFLLNIQKRSERW